MFCYQVTLQMILLEFLYYYVKSPVTESKIAQMMVKFKGSVFALL